MLKFGPNFSYLSVLHFWTWPRLEVVDWYGNVFWKWSFTTAKRISIKMLRIRKEYKNAFLLPFQFFWNELEVQSKRIRLGKYYSEYLLKLLFLSVCLDIFLFVRQSPCVSVCLFLIVLTVLNFETQDYYGQLRKLASKFSRSSLREKVTSYNPLKIMQFCSNRTLA